MIQNWTHLKNLVIFLRSKKTGLQNAQLVQLLAHILKKINPHKQKVKGVTYLSLKEGQ